MGINNNSSALLIDRQYNYPSEEEVLGGKNNFAGYDYPSAFQAYYNEQQQLVESMLQELMNIYNEMEDDTSEKASFYELIKTFALFPESQFIDTQIDNSKDISPKKIEEICTFWEKVGHKCSDTAENMKEKFHEVSDTLIKIGSTINEKINDFSKDMANLANKVSENVNKFAISFMKKINSCIKNTHFFNKNPGKSSQKQRGY